DVGVQSQTGSGKTAAFLIPLLQYYSETEKENWTKTLIIAPTRELVVQIESEIELLGTSVDIKAGSFFGGIGYGKQEAHIKHGVEIIIGTPGRLIDFGKSGKINFRHFGHVVIDEADRLFDMGFYPDIKKMMQMMVPREARRTMLFSATLSTRVMNLAWEYMNNPVTIEIEAESITVNEISQVLMHVSTGEKMSLLLGVLKKENPSSAIIFTNTKYAAVELTERLKVNGYDVHYIMGDLPQRKRLAVINKVKSGEVKFLVATDVAARGLHVNDLDMVVNYDIPEDFENYVHRIGRTARAGKSGRAVTFACEKFVYGLEAIEKYIDMKIPVEWPDKEMFLEDKSAGMNFYREKQAAVNSSGKRPYDNRGTRPGTGRGDPGREGHRGNRRPNQQRRSPQGGSARKDLPKKDFRNERNKGQQKTNSSYRNRRAGSSNNQTQRNMPKSPAWEKKKSNSTGNNVPLKLTRNSNEKERLEYYKNKYGEDFKLDSSANNSGSSSRKQNKKKESFFGKLFGTKSKKGKRMHTRAMSETNDQGKK
ncbi:MAG: DEAD/DEAH box helicase, partial [Spirochaetales bacterium]|nr:DEAD/DEAH box helicase [Spirochaetales bacterium]